MTRSQLLAALTDARTAGDLELADAIEAASDTETLDEFSARIGRQSDEHFARFKPVVDAINAGFEATKRRPS